MNNQDLPTHVQTEQRELLREISSGALLNTNRAALLQNRRARQSHYEIKSLHGVIAHLDARLSDMTDKYEQILRLLSK